MIYLASPYSHPSSTVRALRYHAVAEFVAKRFGTDVIFSPIVYTHYMADMNALPTDAASWQNFNDNMQRAASETWVLKLPGWGQSLGVTHEIEYARALGQDVIYFEA